ncbi:FMN-binding negative transcriptional regulator [Dyella sp.]|uniref:FMN-binding negative transcriptional regulator n=1 Tax=Dyella sp. TaxID=1869338 RepID=UPI002ED027DF
MYTPRAFAEYRSDILHALMRVHPLATVIVQGPSGMAINHLPFEFIDGQLCSHVARGNELADCDGRSVSVVFHGPQGYVSPNWYPSKRVTGRDVPTWNYAVVHVHGCLRVISDRVSLRRWLVALTDRHEADQFEPWHVDDAPADHVEKMLSAIRGITIDVEHIEGKFKLSQNQPEGNRRGVVEGLRQRNAPGDAQLAQWMNLIEESQDGQEPA